MSLATNVSRINKQRLLPDNVSVVWQPLHGKYNSQGKYVMSSQELALTCPADIVFLSSSRGSGKTEVSLVMFLKYVGKGYGEYLRGLYLDLHYADLTDVIDRSKRIIPKIFGNHAKFYSSKGDLKWVWDTGEVLQFAYAETVEDYQKFHGKEYSFILWNEITKHATPDLFDKLMSINRNSFEPKEHPYYIDREYWNKYHIEKRVDEKHRNAEVRYLPYLQNRVIITTNPSGVGHSWVKERFVDVAPAGKLHKIEREIFNPKTQQREIVVKTQCHIFSSYKENYHLTPDYIAELEGIKDPDLRRAWLYGDWSIALGGNMFVEWKPSTHIVEDFELPKFWRLYVGMDWGWSDPFALVYVAVSNGDNLLLSNGKTMKTVKGDLFVWREIYGAVNGKLNDGLKMLAPDIMRLMHEREDKWGVQNKVTKRIVDSAVTKEEDGHSVYKELCKSVSLPNGTIFPQVNWLPCKKPHGSRAMGWGIIRQLLRNAISEEVDGIKLPREKAGIFFCREGAKYLIQTLPPAPRDEHDPTDIQTKNYPEHNCDALRYVTNFLLWDTNITKAKGLL